MFEKIRSYLASELDISEDEITRDTTFESLGVDSLDTVEMVMDLEQELGVELEIEEKIATVGELISSRARSINIQTSAHGKAALLGEIAVPCYPQSAPAGRNS